MSGVGEAPKAKEQSGLVDSVKQAGESVVKTVQQKAGGSQVRSGRTAGSGLIKRHLVLLRLAVITADVFCLVQVGDVVQEKDAGGAQKVAKE